LNFLNHDIYIYFKWYIFEISLSVESSQFRNSLCWADLTLVLWVVLDWKPAFLHAIQFDTNLVVFFL
jgi:hypothetical protein